MKEFTPNLLLHFQLFTAISLHFLISTIHAYNDLDALLSIKASMVGPNGSGLSDWRNDTTAKSHCSFSGVTCGENSRVTSLNVSNLPLGGIIPPEIGLLDKLVNLTLFADNLTGPLPMELSKLASLKYFNLSCNAFNGVFPEQIVMKMRELEIFTVYNNNFTGLLPTQFIEPKRLRVVNLGGNYFSGEIPGAYSEFENLEFLRLSANALTGKIPPTLARLPKLQELYLGYYNSYDGGIPPEFGSLNSLLLLDLASCNLSGEIPPSLGNLKFLHTLFLQENNLTGELPVELSRLVSLMNLDVSLNSLTGEIPKECSQLKNLTLLQLMSNNFLGPVPDFLGNLPNLEVLQIWDNNFISNLPQNLGQNGRLTTLDVSGNRLSGTVPKDLCKGGKLKSLVLMKNKFFGALPEELGECKSLIKIRAMSNFFGGTIPRGIFNLPLLIILELNNNEFTGGIPTLISGNSLQSLTLSNNRITGRIPPAIGNLVGLRTLNLDMNSLVGEIPDEISNLKKLSVLNFRGNSLTAGIPDSISQCSKLTSIDLSENNLRGGIPRDIAKLTVLNVLNLSRNQLTGEIPSDLGSLNGLTNLDLSYNNFTGRRPTNGMLQIASDHAFAGNPNLCSPHVTFCPSDTGHVSNRAHEGSFNSSVTIIIVVVLLTVMLIIALTYILLRKRKYVKSNAWKLTAIQRLDFTAEDVLNCIKEENIIGKGGAGIVYRGCMPNGDVIAIKSLVGRCTGLKDHGFSAEIRTLGKIRHRHIVRLLGYVSNIDTKLLLYEYASNGSLGELLHGSEGGHLPWDTRYRIAVEAAKGLCYLHHDCSPSIIHRDVKCNNILLDSDYEAHLGDFGLAKFLHDDGASEWMSSIAGSFGYIAPEYAHTLKIDQKSDVYSFGVVLLELITGRYPVEDFGEGVDTLSRWVKGTISKVSHPSNTASVLAVLDPRLTAYPLAGVIELFKIAMMCVVEEPRSRPSMREVVHMLAIPPRTQVPLCSSSSP